MEDLADISRSEMEDYGIVKPKQELTYQPVQHHWFYQLKSDDEFTWKPFSNIDSIELETSFNSSKSSDTVVTTEGGRYDVFLSKRERVPVYWRDNPTSVRRCSWFYKGTSDPRLVPYPEDISDILEEEYRLGIITSTWNRKISLQDEEVILHSPTMMMRFMRASSPDAWNTAPFLPKWTLHRGLSGIDVEPGESKETADLLLLIVHGIGEPRKDIKSPSDIEQGATRARTVRRGTDFIEAEDGEAEKSDHLLLLIHGIGSVCDLKMRSVEEVVDNFRTLSSQLLQTHYKSSCDQGLVNKIEVLPISWHWNLHSEETGIDKKMAQITLESVPRFRNFTNDTLLDVLFYTSPKFCQTIIDTVANEMNRIFSLYKARNPNFKGGVSLGGHSLGSLIVFDLLSHQTPQSDITVDNVPKSPVISGAAGTGQLSINYPQLVFSPMSFFALGSPIGMFICVRGIDELGEDFKLPTCPNFFNIFHPFDPVAYRIESLINAELSKLRPVQIPHHKGRKRMHLELKDTVSRVSADIKQKIVDSMKSTWDSFYQLAISPRQVALQERVKEVIEEELIKEAAAEHVTDEISESSKSDGQDSPTEAETATLLKHLGKLNSGRRVDHVLQEAPFELFNEYIFAMASHVCYWESEDTMLLILKEMYSTIGIESDRQTPSSTTIEKSASNDTTK